MIALQFLLAIAAEAIGILLTFAGIVALVMVAMHDIVSIHWHAPGTSAYTKRILLVRLTLFTLSGIAFFYIGLMIISRILAA